MVAQENATKQTICETCGELVDEDKYQKHLKSGHSKKKEFKCDIPGCEKYFTSNYNLQYHIAHHINARSFLCDECPLAYNTKSDLAQHQRSHEKTKAPTTCNVCGEQFQIKSKLNTHMRSHNGESKGLKECPICKKFVTNLREHYKEMHEILTNYICSQCNKGFLKKKVLDRHILTVHQKLRNHMCNICNRGFSDKSVLKRHQRKVHYRTEEKTVYCTQCRKHVKDLKHHYDTVHWDLKFVCEICHRRFSLRKHCNAHMLTMHSKERNWLCDYCGKGFTERYKLVRHFRTHAFYFNEKEVVDPLGKGESKGECPTCKKVVKNLREHHEEVHEKLKNFICPECNKGFYRKGKLDRHILTVHKKQRDHVCNICNRGFGEKSALKKHERRIHSRAKKKKKTYDKEKTVYCTQCKKQVKDLKHHYDTVHCDLKFVCYICHRRFSSRRQCKNHIQTMHSHPLAKKNKEVTVLKADNFIVKIPLPFGCDICGRNFLYLANLRMHMRSHLSVLNRKEIIVDPVEPEIMKFETVVVKQEPELIIDQDPPQVETIWNIKTETVSDDSDEREFDFDINTADFDEPETEVIQEVDFDSVEVKNENEGQVEVEKVAEMEKEKKDGEIKRKMETGGEGDKIKDCEPEKSKPRQERKSSVRAKTFQIIMDENYENIQDTSQIERDPDVPRPKIKCRVCKEQFTSREKYEAHFTAVHNKPFTCDLCSLNYKNPKSLIDHIALHHDPTSKKSLARKVPVTCDICKITYKNRESYNKHVSRFHRPNTANLTCKYCDKVFILERNLKIHRKNAHGIVEGCADGKTKDKEEGECDNNEKPSDQQNVHKTEPVTLVCSYCGKIFTRQRNLQIHVDSVHEKKRHKCDFEGCDKTYTQKTALYHHRKVAHITGKSHICHICGIKTAVKYEMKLHHERHHNKQRENVNKNYVCDECGQPCSTRVALTKHKRRIHGKSGDATNSLECKYCHEQFKKYGIRVKHEAQVHLNGERVMRGCGYCGMEIKMFDEYQAHVRGHEGVFICLICGQPFSDENVMMEHKKGHRFIDKKLKKFVCDICNNRTFTRIHMEYHMIIHLKYPEMHVCDVCGRGFKMASTLYTHRKYHDEGKHVCSYCGKKCVLKSALIAHMRTHTNEKPFKCTVCNRGFNQKQTLAYHHKTHPETRPSFKCEECNLTFNDKTELRSHDWNHHPDKHPFRCNICKVFFRYERNLRIHNLHKHS